MWSSSASKFVVSQVGLSKTRRSNACNVCGAGKRGGAGGDLGKGLQAAFKLPKDFEFPAVEGLQAAVPELQGAAQQAASYTPAVLLQLNAASGQAAVDAATLQEWQRAYEQVSCWARPQCLPPRRSNASYYAGTDGCRRTNNRHP